MTTLGGFSVTPKMRELIDQVLTSGRISYGPLCGNFESLFALKHESLYGVMTNSGTSSLQIALQALKELHGWNDGDEVIVPSLTFVATVNVVHHCKLTPVVVDVNQDYFDFDTKKLIEKLSEKKTTDSDYRIRAIIPVHLFGHPANMKPLMKLAEIYNLKIVEDSCEAMGVSIDGKSVGSWGDAAAFSTYVAHIITTGVGGMTLTRDDDLASQIRSLANHGLDVSQLPNSEHYDPTFLGRHFLFTSIGHSFRATELEAALGLPQLEELDAIIDKRQDNAAQITDMLRELDGEYIHLPKTREGSEHGYMVYPIVVRNQSAEAIRNHLAENKVESRSLLPLVSQPCYNYNPDDYPIGHWLSQSGFYVGCHQHMLPSDLHRMCEVIYRFFVSERKGEVHFV